MLKLIITGGTIDKHYQMHNGNMAFDKTHIRDMLELGRSTAKISIDTVMMKDSLEMDDEDRNKIAQACIETEEQRIIITHGTDTMVQTAATIAAANADGLSSKSIVLVGAMIPYEIRYSDGLFNLGFALGAVQALPAGIYIAMNAQIFAWDKVQKNLEKGLFEAIN